jgi:carbon monoxide dehydrogenase subunit G
MSLETTFDVSVPPDRVFAFLANPRNVISTSHPGPVVDRSAEGFGPGSWFVLAFDQLRVRVEYTEVEPDRRLSARVTMTGRGSGGSSSSQAFSLTALDGGARTRVDALADGSGGWLRWGPLVRASQRAEWRRLADRIEKSA